jgi:hypothetical protein
MKYERQLIAIQIQSKSMRIMNEALYLPMIFSKPHVYYVTASEQQHPECNIYVLSTLVTV